AIPFANRKLFIGTLSFGSGIPSIMEYGDTLNVNVNSTLTVTNATCTNPAGGTITVNATGGIAPYAYSVNGGAFQTSNVLTGLAQGVKTVLIKDAFCGLISKTITVGFTDNLTLTTNNDTAVCAGAPVQMVATSAANTYSWSPAGGLTNSLISNPVATVNSNVAYTVTASLNGCVRTKTVNLGMKPNPNVYAGPDKTIIIGDEVDLEGSGISNPTSIVWTPATNITGSATSYITKAKPTTTTTYSLTIRDNNSCTSTDNAVITVLPYCVKVMEAFTPNGDGINDKWLVTTSGACTSQIIVNVFNRYGALVYNNENYQNDWNGTYKGKPVPDGTYYYVIKYKLVTGNVVGLKGDVTILR
ncbi:MAG: gliding motility-associated C-terminal domain-containing protein, partial [Ferruginibacter sp.]